MNKVFKSQFYAGTRNGIKSVNNTDRAELVKVLNKNAQELRGMSLKDVIERVIEAKYAHKPEMVGKVKQNIPKYLQGDSGIGLVLLLDICQYLDLNMSYTVACPGKQVTVMVEVK